MSQDERQEPRKSREQIQAEIAETRSALSQDLAALGEKLSPEHLKESARGVIAEVKHAASDTIRDAKEAAVGTLRHATDAAVGSLREAKDHAFEAVSETAHEIGERAQRAGYATSNFVSTHAIPLSLVGIGLGWLMLSMNHANKRAQGQLLPRDARGYSYQPRTMGYGDERFETSQHIDAARERMADVRERVGETVQTARSRVGDSIDEARSRLHDSFDSARARVGETMDAARSRVDDLRSQASNLGHDLGARASDLSHQAYSQLQRAGTYTRELTDENPVAVGALALAAGVGVGLLLPSTRREDALLGERRDRLVHDAQRAASRLGESVQRTAGELKGALTESSPR
jgi:ElaB/YqjD/DUF883 family membrane-anchored ribosome-binding protein